MKDFFARLSWVDYIAAAYVCRGLYVGYKSGIFAELLRSVSHLVSAVGSILFHEKAAQYLTLNTFMNATTATIAGFVVCFVILFVVTLVLRRGIIKLLKVGQGDNLQRILGALLGGARWVVLLSLLYMAVGHLPLKQLQTDVQERSLTGAAISRVAPALFGYTGQLTAQWTSSLPVRQAGAEQVKKA